MEAKAGMKKIINNIITSFLLISIISLSLAIPVNAEPIINDIMIENIEFVDSDGQPIDTSNIKLIDVKENSSADEIYNVEFEIWGEQNIEDAGIEESSIQPQGITIVTGSLSVKKIDSRTYRAFYEYNVISRNDIMTQIDIGIYRDYPELLMKRTERPYSDSFSTYDDLIYIYPGVYTLKVISQVKTEACGWLGAPISAGTRTIYID